jgi:hypothetical protein
VASIWMLVAMVIAVRQALDYTGTLRAVGVCLIGWIVQVLILALLLALLRTSGGGLETGKDLTGGLLMVMSI